MITRKVHFSAGFPRGLVLALSAALLCSTATASIVNVAAPTNNWTVLRYGGTPSTDPSVDHQTGVPEGDIVGNSQQASFFTMFGDANTPLKTDGDLAFRVRPAADSGPARFRHPFFVGLNNCGSAKTVGIWAPGTSTNISPSTTTIGNTALVSYAEVAANYNWTAVTSTNDPAVGSLEIDVGSLPAGNDMFVSFSVPSATSLRNLLPGESQRSTKIPSCHSWSPPRRRGTA